jgi:hypothetical protein
LDLRGKSRNDPDVQNVVNDTRGTAWADPSGDKSPTLHTSSWTVQTRRLSQLIYSQMGAILMRFLSRTIVHSVRFGWWGRRFVLFELFLGLHSHTGHGIVARLTNHGALVTSSASKFIAVQ